jgi:hypothetical protein
MIVVVEVVDYYYLEIFLVGVEVAHEGVLATAYW